MPLAFLPDWQTIRPATPVTKVRTYFSLPAFSYSGLVWLGASEIVTQFNYSASKSFVLKELPTKPTSVNYCLAIRYRVGDLVYRWKLWEDCGEVLQAPLYNNEIIKKNFVLEVWSTVNSTTVSQTTPIIVRTSILNVPASFYSPSDEIVEATGQEFTGQDATEVGYTAPSTEVIKQFWFKSDAGITMDGSNRISVWAGDLITFQQLTGSAQPLFIAADPLILNNYPVVSCTQNRGMLGTPDGTEKHLFLVVNPWQLTASNYVWQSGAAVVYYNSNGSPEFSIVFNIGGITDGSVVLSYAGYEQQWLILDISISSSFLATANLYNIIAALIDSDTVQLTGYPDWDTTYIGGGIGASVQSRYAEMIGYNAKLSETERAKTVQYLKIKYGGFSLPLIIDSGGQWLDNT